MREVAADLREVRRKMDDTAVVDVPRRPDRRFLLARPGGAGDRRGRRMVAASTIKRVGVVGSRLDRAVDDDGHRDRRRHLAGRAPAGVGRVGRRHAGSAFAAPRRRPVDRARAGRRRRLLGHRIHARRLPCVLCHQERAESRRPPLCRGRRRRAVDADSRRHRQHDQLLARWTADGVLSSGLPRGRNDLARRREYRWRRSSADRERESSGVLRPCLLCVAILVAGRRADRGGRSQRHDRGRRPRDDRSSVGCQAGLFSPLPRRDIHVVAAGRIGNPVRRR